MIQLNSIKLPGLTAELLQAKSVCAYLICCNVRSHCVFLFIARLIYSSDIKHAIFVRFKNAAVV